MVGPNFDLSSETAAIGDVVLPYDAEDSDYRIYFDNEVVAKMKAGVTGESVFTRTSPVTFTPEKVYLTYAPLHLRTLTPIDNSDMTAGVKSNLQQLVYSIGLGITEEDLNFPFRTVQKKVNDDIDRDKIISYSLIIFAILMVVYMTYSMCFYLSGPVVVLVNIVKSIESKSLQDELPPLPGVSVG